jgi:hypothetical protein
MSYKIPSKAVLRMRRSGRKLQRQITKSEMVEWARKVVPSTFLGRELEWSTAYHEAAHAIVSEMFDFPVECVSIVPYVNEKTGEAMLGVCRHTKETECGGVPLMGPLRTQFWLLEILAGAAAEHKIGSLPFGVVPGSDTNSLMNMLLQTGTPRESWVATYEKLMSRTRELVSQTDVWNAIESLALELLAKPQSSVLGAEVREIVTRDISPTHILPEAWQLLQTLKQMKREIPEPDEKMTEFARQIGNRLAQIALEKKQAA